MTFQVEKKSNLINVVVQDHLKSKKKRNFLRIPLKEDLRERSERTREPQTDNKQGRKHWFVLRDTDGSIGLSLYF